MSGQGQEGKLVSSVHGRLRKEGKEGKRCRGFDLSTAKAAPEVILCLCLLRIGGTASIGIAGSSACFEPGSVAQAHLELAEILLLQSPH